MHTPRAHPRIAAPAWPRYTLVAMADLGYEDMLRELLALIGSPIRAEMKLYVAGERRPLVFLQGVLRRGRDTDISTLKGEPTGFTAGETVMFTVGDPSGTASVFYLVREGFKWAGRWTTER